MKKPVLFTMKMKDEKERERWQKFAKKKYGEPLSVVIRRLIEEDMAGTKPRKSVKLEEIINTIREENNQNYRDIISRLVLITENLVSSTRELTFEFEIYKGLILQKIEEFHKKYRDQPCTLELTEKLKSEIKSIFQEIKL
ncbi:MAG: hypothetical protein HWN67_22505 [Candidatus Helarchaeota archaeon]|nr:hypothetical protein [Candidatus Helarchaeota archaeon]